VNQNETLTKRCFSASFFEVLAEYNGYVRAIAQALATAFFLSQATLKERK
jgi:hypothetical protein